MSRTWDFDDSNMQTLYHSMSKRDHEEFPVIVRAEDYELHGERGTAGLRRFFFKENDEDLKVANKRYKLFNVLHKLVKAMGYGLLLFVLYSLTFNYIQ